VSGDQKCKQWWKFPIEFASKGSYVKVHATRQVEATRNGTKDFRLTKISTLFFYWWNRN
jgi:hypothetical protein